MLQLTVNPDPGFATKECFFTYNKSRNNLYAILPKWPMQNFVINDLNLPAGTAIELVETGEQLSWSASGDGISIKFPAFDPNKFHSEYAYVIRIKNFGDFAEKPQIKIQYGKGKLNPQIILNSSSSGAHIRYTTDGTEPNQSSALYSAPFTLSSAATVKAKAFADGKLASGTAESKAETYVWVPAVKAKIKGSGLKLQFYELNPKSTSELEKSKPVKESIAKSIDLSQANLKENFGLVFSGYTKIEIDGIYNFYLNSDDGSSLWIDDQLLIDNDGFHKKKKKKGTLALKKGYHKIKVAYFQATGGLDLDLNYQLENGPVMNLGAFYY